MWAATSWGRTGSSLKNTHVDAKLENQMVYFCQFDEAPLNAGGNDIFHLVGKLNQMLHVITGLITSLAEFALCERLWAVLAWLELSRMLPTRPSMVARCLGCSLGQLAHFVGYDRKANGQIRLHEQP